MLRKLRLLTESGVGQRLEGLRFSLLRASREFELLTGQLREIERRNPLAASFDEGFTALGRCWTIVDCAERAVRLARSIPFKERSPESRKILNELDKVRKFRNDLQHLEKNADKFPNDAPPMMGAISWQHIDIPLKYHTLFLASGTIRSSSPGLIMDRQEMRFVKDFVFCVFGAEISISEISMHCRRYLEMVEDGLEKSGMTADGEVSPMLFGAEFRFAKSDEIEPMPNK